jgi:hypothetical protein
LCGIRMYLFYRYFQESRIVSEKKKIARDLFREFLR